MCLRWDKILTTPLIFQKVVLAHFLPKIRQVGSSNLAFLFAAFQIRLLNHQTMGLFSRCVFPHTDNMDGVLMLLDIGSKSFIVVLSMGWDSHGKVWILNMADLIKSNSWQIALGHHCDARPIGKLDNQMPHCRSPWLLSHGLLFVMKSSCILFYLLISIFIKFRRGFYQKKMQYYARRWSALSLSFSLNIYIYI